MYVWTLLEQSSSAPVHVRSGVPQGSVLGSLLFNSYVNNIKNVTLSPHSTLIAYADDMLLIHGIHSNKCWSELQTDLDRLVGHLQNNLNLKNNNNKTKSIIFARGTRKLTPPVLTVNGVSIDFVPNFTYLGVALDAKLDYSCHAINVTT